MRLEEFVKETVPRIVDEQSGAVTRKLHKARETFDIENAKISKREQKVPAFLSLYDMFSSYVCLVKYLYRILTKIDGGSFWAWL